MLLDLITLILSFIWRKNHVYLQEVQATKVHRHLSESKSFNLQLKSTLYQWQTHWVHFIILMLTVLIRLRYFRQNLFLDYVQDFIQHHKLMIITCVWDVVNRNKPQKIPFIANFVYNTVIIRVIILSKYITEHVVHALTVVIAKAIQAKQYVQKNLRSLLRRKLIV